jgi:hypothetical protein
MVRKLYKKLTKEQINRGVIFSSTLSPYRFETKETNTHEVFKDDFDLNEHIKRLKDNKFFNESHFKYNIIRT